MTKHKGYETWGFVALMTGIVCIVLGLALFTASAQIAALVLGTIGCIVAGGLFGMSGAARQDASNK